MSSYGPTIVIDMDDPEEKWEIAYETQRRVESGGPLTRPPEGVEIGPRVPAEGTE